MTHLRSCFYTGKVSHTRYAPRKHEFETKLFLSCIDLDELEAVMAKSALWSLEKFNVMSFRRKDYHGDPNKDLKSEVHATIKAKTGLDLKGRVMLLTHLRFFGYVFNPVSFYLCYDEDNNLQVILAEIENTPWGERYNYVVERNPDGQFIKKFDKEFHVSPFMGMNQRYEWRFVQTNQSFLIFMNSIEEDQVVFNASLDVERREITRKSILATYIRQPLMTLKVTALIYVHALFLFIKRVNFYPHPNTKSQRKFIL